jgi:hypothetical protein
MASLEFGIGTENFVDIMFLASNRNEYGGGGVKGRRRVRLTTCHIHVPIVLKSGSLNLLESSGLAPLPLPVTATDATTYKYQQTI